MIATLVAILLFFSSFPFSPSKPSVGDSMVQQQRLRSPCRKYNFSVRTNNNVLSPLTLDVGTCYGVCPSPVTSENTTTTFNRKVIDEFRYQAGDKLIPYFVLPACCAPTKYDPVDMVKLNTDGTISTTTELKAVIAECGCI